MASELPAPPAGEPTSGKYQVLKRLAVGGMAEIYLARVTGIKGFEKHVVLKKIRPVYSEDPRFVAMFLDEARLAAMLHHQNIAQVYDIGELDGGYFFSMEFLHGEDGQGILRNQVERQERLPLEHALTIVRGAAAGLHYAHEKVSTAGKPLNVVHRDVSPSNIFVTYDGAIKVVDFGIARAAQREGPETRSGTLKGKISYMSPEQCRGEELDRRSDVFALGIVLYEMTTTSRLFRKGNDADFLVMQRIVAGEFTVPTSRVPGYPKQLEDVVMRALEVERDARYQTAREMLLDLENVATSLGLSLSTARLSSFLETRFGRKLEPWHTLDQADPEGGDEPGLERTVSTTASPAYPPKVLEELSSLHISVAGDETSARLQADLSEDVAFTQSELAAARSTAMAQGATATATPRTPIRERQTALPDALAEAKPESETQPRAGRSRLAIAGAILVLAAVAAFLWLRPLLADSADHDGTPAAVSAPGETTHDREIEPTPSGGTETVPVGVTPTVQSIDSDDDPTDKPAESVEPDGEAAATVTPPSEPAKLTKKKKPMRGKGRTHRTKNKTKPAGSKSEGPGSTNTPSTTNKDDLIDTEW